MPRAMDPRKRKNRTKTSAHTVTAISLLVGSAVTPVPDGPGSQAARQQKHSHKGDEDEEAPRDLQRGGADVVALDYEAESGPNQSTYHGGTEEAQRHGNDPAHALRQEVEQEVEGHVRVVRAARAVPR